MDQAKREIVIYNEAKNFLLSNTPPEVTDKVLAKYLSHSEHIYERLTLNHLYQRMLVSAQNANMKAGVIGGSIGGVNNLGKVLFNFDPKRVLDKYNDKPEKLLKDIISKLKPNGRIRTAPRSIWPRYCLSILTAAKFFVQFADSEEFLKWVKLYYEDSKSIAALPLILQAEIYGIAFPTACDFLKEIGCSNYGKPDVHIKQIFEAASFVPKGANNYTVLKAIQRIAENVGETPYNVDKLFWLLGSGNLYKHKSKIGIQGRVGSLKKKFLEHLSALRI